MTVKPTLEALEERLTPSTDWIVNTTADPTGLHGSTTLRAALAEAQNGDTISFSSALTGDTIALTSGVLTISQSITITGLGATELAVSGGNSGQVFDIASGVNVSISSLTVENGSITGSGGGIVNNGSLNLSNVAVSGSTATASGGGIYNASGATLTLSNDTFSGNSAGIGSDIDNAAGATLIAGTSGVASTTTLGGSFYNGGNFTEQIASGSNYDVLNVTGGVTLGSSSTLTIDLNGLSIVPLGPINFITDGSQTGQFSAVNVINNPSGYNAFVGYTGTGVNVTITSPAAASWNEFNGNAQHTGISTVAAEPTDQILWSTSISTWRGRILLAHGGAGLHARRHGHRSRSGYLDGNGDRDGQLRAGSVQRQHGQPDVDRDQRLRHGERRLAAPYQPVYDPVTNRVYFPGPGGTLYYISNPDNPGSSTPTPGQVAFYGTSNYTANESAYNSSIYIDTPLTLDSSGNVFFGFAETGSNPSGISDGGIGRVSAAGVGTYVTTGTAVGTAAEPALGSAPALSNDDSILYVAIDDSNGSYLVGVNATTLAPEQLGAALGSQ